MADRHGTGGEPFFRRKARFGNFGCCKAGNVGSGLCNKTVVAAPFVRIALVVGQGAAAVAAGPPVAPHLRRKPQPALPPGKHRPSPPALRLAELEVPDWGHAEEEHEVKVAG